MEKPLKREPTTDEWLKRVSGQLTWTNYLLIAVVVMLALVVFGAVAIEVTAG